MKYQVNFDKERLALAREKRVAHYKGDRSVGIPYLFSVPPTGVSKGWIENNPYTFTEMLHDPEKCVQGQVNSFIHQCDTYRDSDWLPVFKTFMYGEGFIPSMLGAKQVDGGDMPPFQDGRIMSSIYDFDKLPERLDEKLGYGPVAKEAMQRMVESFDGFVPVIITDHQSPYGMATKLMDNEELMLAMYDEPQLVHKLMRYCTDKIAETVKMVEGWIGKENLVLNPNVPVPGEGGIILWDDYVSVISPDMHKEFCKPYNLELFNKFGRGHLHTCGPYFPTYIDAVLDCIPVSVDMAILSGMSRTREDMLLLKEKLNEKDIILNGGYESKSGSIFDESGTTPEDKEFFLKMAKGKNVIWSHGGSKEELDICKTWLDEVE